MNSWRIAAKYLVWVTSLSASLITPPVLCAFAAGWLQGRYGIGSWLMPAAILFGLGGSAVNLRNFFRYVQQEAEKHPREDDDDTI